MSVGVGVDFFTTTPLSQTIFLPDLTQVNFLPETVEVAPSFEQVVPALAAANVGDVDTKGRSNATTKAIRFI